MSAGGRFAALVVEDGTEAVVHGVLQLVDGEHVLIAGSHWHLPVRFDSEPVRVGPAPGAGLPVGRHVEVIGAWSAGTLLARTARVLVEATEPPPHDVDPPPSTEGAGAVFRSRRTDPRLHALRLSGALVDVRLDETAERAVVVALVWDPDAAAPVLGDVFGSGVRMVASRWPWAYLEANEAILASATTEVWAFGNSRGKRGQTRTWAVLPRISAALAEQLDRRDPDSLDLQVLVRPVAASGHHV